MIMTATDEKNSTQVRGGAAEEPEAVIEPLYESVGMLAGA